MFGDFMTSQCHRKKFRVKWEQLPAITAESELVGAAVVTTKGEKIRGFFTPLVSGNRQCKKVMILFYCTGSVRN